MTVSGALMGTMSRVQEFADQLRLLARELGPHAKLPTARELCTQFSISRATLDAGLDQLEQEQVIYRKDRSGIFVSPKVYHKFIAVLLNPWFYDIQMKENSPFWGILWQHIMRETQKRSTLYNETYSFYLTPPADQARGAVSDEVINLIQNGHIHGVLAIGFNSDLCEWLTQQSIPVVVFAGYGSYAVSIEPVPLVQLGVDALAAQGCQKIAWWHRYLASESDRSTFVEILARHGLSSIPAFSRHNSSVIQVPPCLPQDQGYQLVMDVFGRPDGEKPDGIVSTDDMLTDGMLSAFEDLGIHVGVDVKIATHANVGSPILYSRKRRLILLEIDAGEIATAMIQQLSTLLAGGIPEEYVINIQPKLRMNSF